MAIAFGYEFKTAPCVNEPRGRNDNDRIIDQYLLNTGNPISALEIGVNIKRLIVGGMQIDAIAKRHGKSRGWVDQMLSLQEIPPEIQTMVSDGAVAPTLAAEVVRKEGPTRAVAKLRAGVEKAKSEGKSRATKRDVEPAPQRPDAPDEDTFDLLAEYRCAIDHLRSLMELHPESATPESHAIIYRSAQFLSKVGDFQP